MVVGWGMAVGAAVETRMVKDCSYPATGAVTLRTLTLKVAIWPGMAAGTIDQSVVTEVYLLPIIGYVALRTLALEVI